MSENGRKTGRKLCTRVCSFCKKEIVRNRRKYCKTCFGNIIQTDNEFKLYTEATKGDFLNRGVQKHARIRVNARSTAKKYGILNECRVCGYSKHVDCAHIKAIAKYSENTLISEINNKNNLIGLCKNHHWELDHDFLTISEIFSRTDNRSTKI